MNDSLTRRNVLKATGGLAVLGLAGCTGNAAPEAGNEVSHEDSHDDETAAEQATESDGGHGHAGGTIGDPAEHATVTMLTEDDSYHFHPHVVHVKEGGTVTFELESGTHTATAYHPDNDAPRRVPEGTDAWDSGVLSESGATYEVTFDEAGVYDYHCVPHESVGMIGSVVVGEPPLDGPGMSPPSDDLLEGVHGKVTELNEMVEHGLDDGGHDEGGHEEGGHEEGGHDDSGQDGGHDDGGHDDGDDHTE
ncbi:MULTISPECIES: plastocyanin/azurin family copper-binding protein [Haloferax]|uniref:Blue (type 1) copper domain-containing protein n=1 Tax=Haloferax marinum TaxID=2666143 RepID=A0A6A8G7Z8_9EURY|nr:MULTISPECIES: plastocyanin/azurin family copper-binding protein [Haloferax]KAB1197932.1 hypothetical protein Hfx1150_10545 [Haloferax sp. CBA1150]MRW96997.1 hypothetical protein [Haloferax marinum]